MPLNPAQGRLWTGIGRGSQERHRQRLSSKKERSFNLAFEAAACSTLFTAAYQAFVSLGTHRVAMFHLFELLLTILLFLSGSEARINAQTAAGTGVYAVSYVEVVSSGRSAMIAALKRYRDTSRGENGYVRFELLEQVGRPGHFAIIEVWKDQQAFAAHETAALTEQFRNGLASIRVSGYDQRLYKALTVATPTAAGNGQALHVLTHVDTLGGSQAEAPALLERLAEASRSEQGCQQFDVLQHTTRANHFTVIETWQSEKALEAHAAAPHTKQYRDRLQPISGSPLDERLYRAVE